MYRWLILIVAGFILYKLFLGDRGRKKTQEAETKTRMAATGEMVKDPVCGTYVPADADIRVRDGNKVYAFCSYECRDAFVKRLEATRTESVEHAKEAEHAEEGRG
ncbi:transcriptional regulator [Desulfovibrio sp. JY]|uniref:transcriptional regulator n=1 Tax=Solidesulfovibrio sp. C21 TaxID=3398613 RepID=UPI0039FCB885|nr:transcriptional regulator [Desulfovibrio sp. JY]